MKKLLFFLLIFCISIDSISQTATNFSVQDCNGVNHDLFSKLDAGKVVVICWVMPCAPCTGPALTSYNVVKDYQENYPEGVLYYLVDDYANTTCEQLDGWANSRGIPANNTFSFRFSDPAIKMSDYGTDGMPKTIVLGGGAARKVFYNINDGIDHNDLIAAIEEALVYTGIDDPSDAIPHMVIHPNPAKDKLKISHFSQLPSEALIQITDIRGKVIASFLYHLSGGDNLISLDISEIPSGMYFLSINGPDGEVATKFVISH